VCEAVRVTLDISGIGNGLELASSRLEAVDRLKRHPKD
jgi:hypothetical protein